jgi:hypothetical protein
MKLKYNYQESNEAYKLNVTHLTKIREFLSDHNQYKKGSLMYHSGSVPSIPGMFHDRL